MKDEICCYFPLTICPFLHRLSHYGGAYCYSLTDHMTSFFTHLKKLRTKECVLLKIADTECFAMHSFRKDGTFFYFKSGVLGAIVQLFRNWASDCYLRYLIVTRESLLDAVFIVSRSVPVSAFIVSRSVSRFIVSRGGRKTSPRTSTIVQFIFYFWSFEISVNIFRNHKWLV